MSLSHSLLSLRRYGTPTNYHRNTGELFAQKNEILNPDETLPRLLSDFKKLFEQTQDTTNYLYDTILNVSSNNQPIYAQRQLLIARSAYFENLFTGDSHTEDFDYFEEDGVVTITFTDDFYLGMDITLLREVVAYMYWGYWEPRNIERTKQLYEIASKLDLKELRNNAGEEITKQLSPRNVADFLVSAHEHDGKLLKKVCIDYIIQNKRNIDMLYLEKRLINSEIGRSAGAKLIAEIYHSEVSQKNTNVVLNIKI